MKAGAVCGLLLVSFLGLAGGCSKESETPKYRELHGRVSGIDSASGIVRMMWFNPKQNKDIELAGKLAPDAEIIINGATARLEDVHVDDKVTVTGREEKRDGERQLVATRVEVTRAATLPATTGPG